jgi:hypothetical protein
MMILMSVMAVLALWAVVATVVVVVRDGYRPVPTRSGCGSGDLSEASER